MDASAEVEKKLGLSLDELIAQQKAKQAKKGAGGAAGKKKKVGATRVQKVQTKGGGRVLVVPRPKHVPRPSGKQDTYLKATRGGGVHKGGVAPKFAGGAGGYGGQQGGGRQGHAVKVTIGNKLSGRPASHIPTSGVLAKPFYGGASGSGGPRSGGSRSAMQVDGGGYGGGSYGGGGHAGGSLGSRFDSLQGVAPQGPARPTGAPRRNAHGVILP